MNIIFGNVLTKSKCHNSQATDSIYINNHQPREYYYTYTSYNRYLYYLNNKHTHLH